MIGPSSYAPVPLTRRFGRRIDAAPGGVLADLDVGSLLALFAEEGAVLLRGFGGGRDGFVGLSERASRGFSTYQGGFFRDRRPVERNETLLTVTASREGFAVPLHGEMYYTKNRPAMLWFYCERPPDADGETTLCDGEQLWQRMSDEAKATFTDRRVKYVRHLPDGAWQEAFQTDDLDVVARHCAAEDTRLSVGDDGGVVTEFLDWAVAVGRSGARDTFVNNVVALYLGELAFRQGTSAAMRKLSGGTFQLTVRMEDGAPVPGRVIKELMGLHRRSTHHHVWHEGDVLLVDNRRMLHGRAAFTGARDIYVRLASASAGEPRA